MQREKDDLSSNIERDADERAKLHKIMNKFFDYAKRQEKLIQDSNAQLDMLHEELADLLKSV